jgi:hypothetical protein
MCYKHTNVFITHLHLLHIPDSLKLLHYRMICFISNGIGLKSFCLILAQPLQLSCTYLHNILFFVILCSISVSLNCVFWSQHMVKPFKKKNLVWQSLPLIGLFNSLTFKVVSDTVGFMLLIFFLFSMCLLFFAPYSSLLLSELSACVGELRASCLQSRYSTI